MGRRGILAAGALLLLAATGCVRMEQGPPPVPWREVYREMETPPAVRAFIRRALGKAEREYGAPVFPVRQVLLRRSRKKEAFRRYPLAEDFALTECADPRAGLFVIYLPVDPADPDFYPLLGHECAHLLDPRIFDWYMEGFATVFSEEICAEAGRPWPAKWRRRFERRKSDPYAVSYRMMRALRDAFPEHYRRLPRCSVPVAAGSERLRIDIDGWLAGLPPADRRRACRIIGRYAKVLQHNRGPRYSFTLPAEMEEP